MGSDLRASSNSQTKSLQLMIIAQKDPMGANLDRVQVIKGWLDSSGHSHEKVFDVALSGNRTGSIGSDGILMVGNTVDVGSATYENSIGSEVLKAFWVDPEFNSDESSFYYVRVLEIPTPRWNAYDAVRYGLTDEELVEDRPYGGSEVVLPIPKVIQERAYSSPIWFSPS
jgi:hypothetical protein